MPTYPEGTRQWAEQERDQGYTNALAILSHNGFDPETYGVLRDIPRDVWLAHSKQSRDDALDAWDAYRIWKSQFGAMSECLADGIFPEATEPIYSPAELEAAGQGRLL